MLFVETFLFLSRTISYEKYAGSKPKEPALFGKKAIPSPQDEGWGKCLVQ
jgi:hypothetical protein